MRLRRELAREIGRELLLLGALGAAIHLVFALAIHPLVGWPTRAPVPVRTLALVAAIGFLRRRSGETWADFGLYRPRSSGRFATLVVLGLAAKLWLVAPAASAISSALALPKPDLSFIAHLHGNAVALAGWLVVAWVVGGFAEELVFRGFLMQRIARLFGSGRVVWTTALVAQAALFGAAHFYVGVAGIVSGTLSALLFGIVFLAAGRNLWPVMIVHAIWDTLGVVLIYLNGTPSTG